MNEQAEPDIIDRTDALTPFIFVDAPVRGAIVRLEHVWTNIARGHAPEVAQLLGEMLSGTALLAHLLKDTGVALQTRGDGIVHTVVTECFGRDGLRGIARLRSEIEAENELGERPSSSNATAPANSASYTAFVADEVADIESLLGRGDLAITLRPPVGEAHQGIVPLQGVSVSGCIEHYFTSSEQLATHMWLSAKNGVAAGLLLQRIPIASAANEMSDARAEALWDEVSVLASTLTSNELRASPLERLLTNLFRAHPIRVLPSSRLSARCTCSRERSLGVLQLLGRAEVDSVLAERGVIDMRCQFCGTGYLFNGPDVAALWDR